MLKQKSFGAPGSDKAKGGGSALDDLASLAEKAKAAANRLSKEKAEAKAKAAEERAAAQAALERSRRRRDSCCGCCW